MCTIHDGHRVPECARNFARELDPKELEREFARERDWGADAIAQPLAYELGLKSYKRVTTARVFLDCGRPRGISTPEARGLDTKSVPHRIAGQVTPPDIRQCLAEERDRFGTSFGHLLERTLEGAGRRVLDSGALFLAIHTYDRFDSEGNERAPIGLVYRPRNDGPPPEHLPPEALRDTSDLGLIRKLAEGFQKLGLEVSHNDPYVLPMGGLEIPALNWMFERAQEDVEDPQADPCHPRRRPSALVIEYRKDLLLDGFSTETGWYQPCKNAWKRDAIRRIALCTASSIQAHFAEIDPKRFAPKAA